jgi:mRNA interferase RelE/StbE
MTYSVEFRSAGWRDFSSLDPIVSQRVADKLELLKQDLSGDVKRLKQHVPRYRLRVGDWRVLFEVRGTVIEIWRVAHRRDVYDR